MLLCQLSYVPKRIADCGLRIADCELRIGAGDKIRTYNMVTIGLRPQWDKRMVMICSAIELRPRLDYCNR
jgi:hypothetical protein